MIACIARHSEMLTVEYVTELSETVLCRIGR